MNDKITKKRQDYKLNKKNGKGPNKLQHHNMRISEMDFN